MTKPATAAFGRDYLAIPGPSVIPDAVLRAMHRAAPNIYTGELVDITASVVADLCKVARTAHHCAIYVGNGHAAWEASLANTVAPGERVLVPATGSFGHGWGEMAAGLGAEVDTIDFGKRAPMDMDRIAEALRADTQHKIKAVLAVHVDTSSSVRNDIAALREVLDALGHPALLMADCIASLGCDVFEMDQWGVDVMVTGCQKGLMVPPGTAFVFFNDKADTVRRAMPRVSRYWDWSPRANPEVYYQHFCGTAPTHHIYGLRTALDMIADEGIEQVWARHALLARAIWAACDVWAEGRQFELNVPKAEWRSCAVTSLRLPAPLASDLRQWTEQNLNLTLGIGLGMVPLDDPAWHGFFRLGHMGHVSGHMVLGLLGGIEAGLAALNVPRGSGAVDAAARVIAGAEAAPIAVPDAALAGE